MAGLGTLPSLEARTIWGEKAQGAPLRCYRRLEAVESTGMRHPLQRWWFPHSLQGHPGTLRGRWAHMHITPVVRLCRSFRSFCKRISLRKLFAEPSLPLPASTSIQHHDVPPKASLFLTSGFSSFLCSLGQKAGAEQPCRHQSWALPACSSWEEPALGAQPSPGLICPHLMAKDRVHVWDVLSSLLQMRGWGRFTAAAGGMGIQAVSSGARAPAPAALAAEMYPPSLLPCAPGLGSSAFLKQRTFSFFWKKAKDQLTSQQN